MEGHNQSKERLLPHFAQPTSEFQTVGHTPSFNWGVSRLQRKPQFVFFSVLSLRSAI